MLNHGITPGEFLLARITAKLRLTKGALSLLGFLVIGFMIALVSNTVGGNDYSRSVSEYALKNVISPFINTSGAADSFYSLLKFSGYDLITVLFLTVAGWTVISKTALSMMILLRGFSLGAFIGALAASLKNGDMGKITDTPLFSSLIAIVFYLFSTFLISYYAISILKRSDEIRNTDTSSELNLLFSRQTFDYFITALTGVGCVIIIRLIHATLLWLVTHH